MLMTVLKVFINFYDVFSDNRFFEEEWVKKDTWIFLYKLKYSNFSSSNIHCFTLRVQNSLNFYLLRSTLKFIPLSAPN